MIWQSVEKGPVGCGPCMKRALGDQSEMGFGLWHFLRKSLAERDHDEPEKIQREDRRRLPRRRKAVMSSGVLDEVLKITAIALRSVILCWPSGSSQPVIRWSKPWKQGSGVCGLGLVNMETRTQRSKVREVARELWLLRPCR
ncbi:hypothetical protein K469DRAFT_39636 [Zopfia rhizophila CBS 207.26]|uniref:Uncharacterized protein n=1 Tax=Zopfia rhizophila CBS 207.26 TaxID=1314779 RepID=A0A6A6EFU3_9PEZI|nr:hypothetical protein K469DRAFT_39636 [Zopfia rhizophila CBS 207.26]